MKEMSRDDMRAMAKICLNRDVVGFNKLPEAVQKTHILAFCMGMTYQKILEVQQEQFETKNNLNKHHEEDNF